MPAASSSTDLTIPDYLPGAVKRWKQANVRAFLNTNKDEYDLDDEDIEIVKQNKVAGMDFLELTVEQLRSFGLGFGPAARIIKLIEKLKESKGLVEQGKRGTNNM